MRRNERIAVRVAAGGANVRVPGDRPGAVRGDRVALAASAADAGAGALPGPEWLVRRGVAGAVAGAAGLRGSLSDGGRAPAGDEGELSVLVRREEGEPGA